MTRREANKDESEREADALKAKTSALVGRVVGIEQPIWKAQRIYDNISEAINNVRRE